MVSFEVDPRVTHKASGIAVAQGCTTVDVLRGWIERTAGLAVDEDPAEAGREERADGKFRVASKAAGPGGITGAGGAIVNNRGTAAARSKRQFATHQNSTGQNQSNVCSEKPNGKSPQMARKSGVTKSEPEPRKMKLPSPE